MKHRKKRGELFEEFVEPLIQKVNFADVLQIIIGSTVLAIPIGFTEEAWRLGESLPFLNVVGIFILSLSFISLFTYYHYHHQKLHHGAHRNEFVKRIFLTYFFSFFVVAVILSLIQHAPWFSDFSVALRRTVIVTFPSSMSAVIADRLK